MAVVIVKMSLFASLYRFNICNVVKDNIDNQYDKNFMQKKKWR